jgi:hypothetical protein
MIHIRLKSSYEHTAVSECIFCSKFYVSGNNRNVVCGRSSIT